MSVTQGQQSVHSPTQRQMLFLTSLDHDVRAGDFPRSLAPAVATHRVLDGRSLDEKRVRYCRCTAEVGVVYISSMAVLREIFLSFLPESSEIKPICRPRQFTNPVGKWVCTGMYTD